MSNTQRSLKVYSAEEKADGQRYQPQASGGQSYGMTDAAPHSPTSHSGNRCHGDCWVSQRKDTEPSQEVQRVPSAGSIQTRAPQPLGPDVVVVMEASGAAFQTPGHESGGKINLEENF